MTSRRAGPRFLPTVILVLLVLGPVAAAADPAYGPPLPGFDPVIRATRDPRLLGVERLYLREQLMRQGVEPLRWAGGPSLFTTFRHQMRQRSGVDLERTVELLEVNGALGLRTVFRYPEYFFLVQVPETLPGGFVYYPPRAVTDPDVDLFVDSVEAGSRRSYELMQLAARLDALDVAGGGRRTGGEDGLLNLTIPVKLPRTLESIIGRGEKTRIKITGRERISISGESSVSNKFTPSERVQSQSLFPTLDMEQELQISLSGQIGEKIFIEVDHNSEIIGPDATKIRLYYRGTEDDIIQSIETGDVGLTLPGSNLLGYSSSKSGLFGVKVTGKMGPADFTVVASKQKAETSSKSFNAQGGQETEHVIESWNYLNNRFFRLDLPRFPSGQPLFDFWWQPDSPGRRFDPTNPDLPQNEWIDASSIKLFRFAGGGQPQPGDVQYVAAVIDTTGRWDENGQITAISGTQPANTDAWDVYGQRWTEIPAGSFTVMRDVDDRVVALDVGRQLARDEILAVSYRVVRDRADPANSVVYEVGDRPSLPDNERQLVIDGQRYLRLKLLKPRILDPYTYQYVLRNIYSLGGANIDAESFDLRIERSTATQDELRDSELQGEGENETSYPFIRIFGLDRTNPQGDREPDGLVDKNDGSIFDLRRGLLKFPEDFPFPFAADPAFYEFFAGGSWSFEESYLAENLTPEIYDWTTNVADYSNHGTFRIVSTHAAASSSFNLGVSNIEEGSESVTLDGRTLARDTDYRIDYLTGEIELLGDAANLTPDSQLRVNYQYAPFLGGGKSSLMGFNLSYSLGRDSRLNTTWLYRTESIVGEKAKLGEEPSKMLVGSTNLAHQMRLGFLTDVANVLSRVSSEKESTLGLNAEVAVSIPDPNTRDEVYLEDFEGIDASDNITLSRAGWMWASAPVGEFARAPQDRVETVAWYLPKDGVLRRYLNPTLRDQERTERQPALEIYMRESGGWSAGSWGGIMRGLSSAGIDLSRSQFLEFWVNDAQPQPELRRGKLHIDFGYISEDFWWDVAGNFELGTFQREDINGDGIFFISDDDDNEDIGLDRVRNNETFSAEYNEELNYFDHINVTEGNNREDSEDLNGNTILDLDNGYFSVVVDLRETEPLVDVVRDYEDTGDLAGTSWRKYRVPLSGLTEVAESLPPEIRNVTHIRIWYEPEGAGAAEVVRLQLSELKFLGSRWQRDGIRKQGTEQLLAPAELGPGEGFFLGEVNNKENPDYHPPFAVHEENRIPEKEQSLVLDFQNLEPEHVVRTSKLVSPRGDDYTRYERLSWYWYNPSHEQADVELFFRVGLDTLNYYEVAYRFAERSPKDGWNYYSIHLADLTNVKNLPPDPDTGIIEGTVPHTETGVPLRVRVVGQPDLRTVRRYYFGVRNPLQRSISGYFYFNDVKLLEVKRDKGLAQSASVRLDMADVIKLDFDWQRRDAEFHGLDRDVGQGILSEDWSLAARFRMNDFVPLLGFQLPVNLTRRQSVQRPKYETNSDVEIQDEAVRNAESTVEEREGFSTQLRHRPTQFFLTRYLVDPWVFSLSGSRSLRNSPQERRKGKTLQGSAGYDLSLPGVTDLSGVPLLGSLPLIKGVSLLPNKISFGGSFNHSENFAASVNRDGSVVERPATGNSRTSFNGAFDYAPLKIATISFQGRSERDRLRPYEVAGVNIGKEIRYTQDLRIDFIVPKSTLFGESRLLAPLRTASRFMTELKPSISFRGGYVDNRDPSLRQGNDPEGVHSVTNSGSWEFRARVPLGDTFQRIFPERKRSAEEEQRLIERQRRVQMRGRGQAAQEAETDPDDPNLTPEERLERERRRLLEQAALAEEEERRGEAPPEEAEGGGPSLATVVDPVLGALRGLGSVQVSYSTGTQTSFGRLRTDAPFWYRLGVADDLGDVPDSLYVTSRANHNQQLSASTNAKLSRTVALDVKYAVTHGRNEASSDFNRSYMQDWPDLRLAMTGLEKWGIFGSDDDGRDGWFSSSSLDVSYKKSLSVLNFTDSSHDPRTSVLLSPRWNVTLQSGLNVSLSGSWNSDRTHNYATVTETDRTRLGLQVRHSFEAERLLAKLGLYRPGNRPNINLDVDLSYTTSGSRRLRPGSPLPSTETGQTRWQFTPRFSYTVTRNLSGALFFSYSRSRVIETDLVTQSFGLGMEATFVF
ncbi:MAG: cell surface protein SprA [Candidatus Krumholzibacteriia bacterium]